MASENVLGTVREEDFIEYFIFPTIETNDVKEQEQKLSGYLKKCNQIIKRYTAEYLWHKDSFQLISRSTITNSLIHLDGRNENYPPHLYGITHYGENIEDEWFIVFLLNQICKEITDVIVKVSDSDGEFLLIEAAEHLPSWANPQNCDNRVFLYRGNVHIIYMEEENDNGKLEIGQALAIIKNEPLKFIASDEVQSAINCKINGYPNKIKENLHCAKAYLPVGVAVILKRKPNLISAVVHSFCSRDSVDLKACRAMKYFPPEQRVYTNVTFSKCLYAMITHSNYVPDRRTGWNLPSTTSALHKSNILGVKIACGFEILISQARPSGDVESDKGWHNYLKSLNDKNYFNDLLEHSRDYNNLLNKAKEYYINHRDSIHYSPAIGQEVLELTKTVDYKLDDIKNEEESLPQEDSDDWLNVSPEELDKMLQERYGQKKVLSVNNNSDASTFAQKVNTFLNHISDVDGAEFPDENNEFPVAPPRTKKSKGKNKVSFKEPKPKNSDRSSDNKINFDPSAFSCAVQNILNFVIPEDDSWDLESGSEMSDYEDDNYVNVESCKENIEMQKYMAEMDRELAGTTIGESFEKKNGDNFDDIESFQPVDIDVNALKNILESYKSQLGEAGPSSNMLGPMGVQLDTNKNS